MRDVPKDLSEENVAAWMRETCCLNVQRIPAAELREWERSSGKEGWRIVAAHVLALVREKVRECIAVTESRCAIPRFAPKGTAYASINPGLTDDEIVARVLGDKEVRRG